MGPDFVFKKKIQQFLGCAPSARTWGTPDSDKKRISLDANYTGFQNRKYIFLLQIWRIQSETFLGHYWLFADALKLPQWQPSRLEDYLLENLLRIKAEKWWFWMWKMSWKDKHGMVIFWAIWPKPNLFLKIWVLGVPI